MLQDPGCSSSVVTLSKRLMVTGGQDYQFDLATDCLFVCFVCYRILVVAVVL